MQVELTCSWAVAAGAMVLVSSSLSTIRVLNCLANIDVICVKYEYCSMQEEGMTAKADKGRPANWAKKDKVAKQLCGLLVDFLLQQ